MRTPKVETSGSRGFSLIEMMIAMAVLALICSGILVAVAQTERNNRLLHDEDVAFRAAHQMLEIQISQDYDSMLLNNGLEFDVVGVGGKTIKGKVTMNDLNWNGLANMAYEVVVEIPITPAYTARLTAVRVRV